MLVFHPLWQLAATVLAAYVLFLGLQRFGANHLGGRTVFRWKRHVLLGQIALAAMFLGIGGGLFAVWQSRPSILVTGLHGLVGLVIGALIVIGYGTGLYMNRNKRKRIALPFFHGVVNLAVFVLALTQIYTGYQVYQFFAAGY